MKLTPAASTRTTTWPGPAEGSFISARRRTAGPPNPSIRMAFMEYPRRWRRIAYDESCYAREGEGRVRKLSRREKGLLGLLAAGVVAVAVWALRHPEAPAARTPHRPRPRRRPPPAERGGTPRPLRLRLGSRAGGGADARRGREGA